LPLIHWISSQLISYGPWPWALFIAIALTAPRLLRTPGIFLGHLLVAILIATLDFHWIQSEMKKPDWNTQPDQDVVFIVGVLLRILLINTTLLPVSLLALRLRRPRNPVPSPPNP
jgi:hypothetical protein